MPREGVMKRKHIYWIIAVVMLSGCGMLRDARFRMNYGPVQPVDRQLGATVPGQVSFVDDVQPILNNRCDVCHGCYDAPCQLRLTSFDGLDRGGSNVLVYNATRLLPDKPTRLFIDADSTEQWRKMKFHPVLNERDQTEEAHLENSVLNLMLQLKKDNPLPQTELLPGDFDLNIDRNETCATAEEFKKYKKKYPLWGMPYALPGLTEKEHQTIVDWIKQGARAYVDVEASGQALQVIDQWENFFNRSSLKQQLVARYIYEHLFIAHIHFESLPDREFYRLVRSKTPPGEPVDEINSVRPFDDPGVEPFYYRLRRVNSTIVVKKHTVYHMTRHKMSRYEELFFSDDYEVEKLPSYKTKTAANPFKTFADLPARSRYQFILDDAHFFVMCFIKGPVCRGQIALNVINDHFFVAFFDPDNDTISNDSEFLSGVSDYLSIPSEKKNNIRIMSIWYEYSRKQKKYLEAKEKYLVELNPDNIGNNINYIWDGDGHNDNTMLTVFRHFDSATVVKGFVGGIPKTGWIIDYPLIERIYYLLVAGFDVFGNFGHQTETRLYMDFLRMEGEKNFLSFLPKDIRRQILADWYKGAKAELSDSMHNSFHGLERRTGIIYETDDPKKEFFEKIMEHAGSTNIFADTLNRCADENDVNQNVGHNADAGVDEDRVEHALQKLACIHGPQIQIVPDVTFLHIVTGIPERDLAYTVVRNKALSNNSFLFGESRRRIIKDDSLTIVKGHLGNYPNAFCRIPVERIDQFVDEYGKIKDKLSYYYFAKEFAIGRTHPDFWAEADWHYRKFLADSPVEGGQFDLNRFGRISEKADMEFAW